MGFCGLRRLKNQRNTFFICTSTRENIAVVVVVQIKIFLHYHYGAVARNISISYRKMVRENPGIEISQWPEKEKNKNEKF